MAETKLKGKVALVTGANSGIGASIAKAFAAQGAAVVVHFLEGSSFDQTGEAYTIEHKVAGRPAAEEVVKFIEERGGSAIAVAGDLSDPTALPTIFDRAEEALGRVDILVNNAAHCELPDTIFSVSAGNIDRHFAVNTRAAVLLIGEFVRRYRKREASWGRVINVSTDAAQTFASQISYGASKAALEAYTRSLAIEVGPLGITVNTVAPGPVQTGWISPELEAELLPLIPLRRVGTPEDIADVVVFLASDQARWLTGQVIKVSGGHAL
jgi:3-oxoacyl-[acyl-carrier protein] reductase